MVWDIDPVIFSIGSFGLRYYPLMFILGITLGTMYAKKNFEKGGEDPKLVDTLQSYIIVGMIIGARLGHCLFYDPAYYLSHPLEILQIWKGGLASHGGFLGVTIAVYLFSKKIKAKSFLWIIEACCPAIVLTASLIRVGNFFNSEILGHPTDSIFGVVFKKVDTIARHPAQLYESIAYLILAIILHFLWNKFSLTKKWREGQHLGLVFMTTFSARFLLEFFKINQSSFEDGMLLNMGQLLSIPFILAGAYLFFVFGKKSIST